MRPNESFSENVIKQQHEKNKNEAWKALKLGRVAQSKDFKEWKKSICQWIDKNPEFGCDLLRWEYEEGAIVWGGESWGVIWDQIRSHIDFKDKTVIEVGCGMGLAAVHHALLARVTSIHFGSILLIKMSGKRQLIFLMLIVLRYHQFKIGQRLPQLKMMLLD